MRLVRSLLQRPRGCLAICACLMVLGGLSLTRLPINLYPKIEFPTLTITTYLSESSPQEIETLITIPIEEAVADIPGLRTIQAVSREGESEITLQFNFDQEIAEKAMGVRTRIRRLYPSLPSDARFPIITRYDPSDAPLAVLAVTGGESPEVTGRWVNRELKPELARIDGVATVRVSGAPRSQILVECDIGRLQAHSLAIRHVVDAIGRSHAAAPGGAVVRDGRRLTVITQGALSSPADVAQVPMWADKIGSRLKVDDIARVSFAADKPAERTRYNGRDLITVTVYRATGSDLRAIWRDMSRKLEELRQRPMTHPRPNVDIVVNQATHLEDVLDRLWIILGATALITALVLFTFLRRVWTTFVVLMAIPFSLLTTILAMQILGISLDLLSLGGLTLGIGILVDNAIVVLESISRRQSEGVNHADAAARGTSDVSTPLILSTTTTVVVFVPVLFASREIRLLFSGFAWTVGSGLFASLIAALVFIPVLFDRMRWTARTRTSEASLSRLSETYSRALGFVESHRLLAFVIVVSLLGCAAFQSTRLSFRQTLPVEVRRLKVVMVMAPGTATKTTAAKVLETEKQLMALPFVTGVHSEVRNNQANLTLSVKTPAEGGIKDPTNSSRLRRILADRKDTQFHIMPVGSQGQETRITVYLEGPSLERLRSIQEKARLIVGMRAGVQDIMVLHRNQIPVMELKLNRALLGASGVGARDAAYHVRRHFTGPISTRIMTDSGLTDVRVRAFREDESGMGPLQRTMVPGARNTMLPFAELAEPSVRLAEGELHRRDRRRVISMAVLLDQDSDPLKVGNDIRTALNRMEMPPEYGYTFGDELDEIRRTRREMFEAVGMALVFIYLILIAATESLLRPFLIMTALPFSIAGAVSVLSLFDVPVSLPVYVGLMVLCGLIVNVNVVMIYTINALRQRGRGLNEAVFAGARRRLRAILMTLLTTVFATMPMLMDRGQGSSMWSPFALTLASGICAGSVFSLMFTPLLYKTMEQLKQRITGSRVP